MAVTLFDPPYTKIPCYTQTLWLYVLYNRSYCRWKFYNAGIGIFDLLLLWPWSWPSDLHRRTWPVFRGDTSDVQIWSSYVKAFESIVWQTAKDRQTDTAEIIYRAASRVNYTIPRPFRPPQTIAAVLESRGVKGIARPTSTRVDVEQLNSEDVVRRFIQTHSRCLLCNSVIYIPVRLFVWWTVRNRRTDREIQYVQYQ